jgi:hypothetical protein
MPIDRLESRCRQLAALLGLLAEFVGGIDHPTWTQKDLGCSTTRQGGGKRRPVIG